LIIANNERLTKKNKTKSVLVLFAILGFLTILRLIWFFYHAPSEQPMAQDGLLDLRGYDLQDVQTVTLDGEWTFYAERLVEDPQELHVLEGNHTEMSGGTDQDSSYKFGTYYLKVLIDENTDLTDLFSISIPSTKTASVLFVNGHLKDQSGDVAADAEHHSGKGSPYVVSFSAEKNEIDIMLQVSNFDTSKGIAVSSPIKFGSSKAIAKNKNFEDILVISLVVILVLHSVYSLLLYIFISRKKIMLFFTVGFFISSYR